MGSLQRFLVPGDAAPASVGALRVQERRTAWANGSLAPSVRDVDAERNLDPLDCVGHEEPELLLEHMTIVWCAPGLGVASLVMGTADAEAATKR